MKEEDEYKDWCIPLTCISDAVIGCTADDIRKLRKLLLRDLASELLPHQKDLMKDFKRIVDKRFGYFNE